MKRSVESERFDTTAAEVTRNFGHWQDRAMQAPVRVTHHGRPRVVIVSAEDFERLSAEGPGPAAAPAGDVHRRAVALERVVDEAAEAFIALDGELRITAVNRAAETFLGPPADQLVGRPIEAVERGGRPGVFTERYRWVLKAGEAITFEAEHYLRPGRALEVRAFPHLDGVGLLLSNRTELMGMRRECEGWKAMRVALEAHPRVATAMLNVLGFFTAVNAAFSDLVGFAEDRLGDARLVDLLVSSDRQQVAQGLNRLMQGGAETFSATTGVLTAEATRRPLTLSIAPRMRDMVCDGFAVVALEANAGAGQ